MSDELRECAFCEHDEARVIVVDEVTDAGCEDATVPLYAASCPYCGARGPMALSEDEAVEAWNRLGYLIEPSGHGCVPGECPINVRHDNDRIDRDALLALADDLERPMRDGGYSKRIARRIREALGVSDDA